MHTERQTERARQTKTDRQIDRKRQTERDRQTKHRETDEINRKRHKHRFDFQGILISSFLSLCLLGHCLH